MYYHEPDLEEVFKRSHEIGCDKIIIKGRNYKDLEACYKMTKLHKTFFISVGVHPVF